MPHTDVISDSTEYGSLLRAAEVILSELPAQTKVDGRFLTNILLRTQFRELATQAGGTSGVQEAIESDAFSRSTTGRVPFFIVRDDGTIALYRWRNTDLRRARVSPKTAEITYGIEVNNCESLYKRSLASAVRAMNVDPKWWFVIDRRFALEGSMTLQEVGDQLGVSRERVRQLQSKGLQRGADQLELISDILDAWESQLGVQEIYGHYQCAGEVIANCMTAVLEELCIHEADEDLVTKIILLIRGIYSDASLRNELERWPKVVGLCCLAGEPIAHNPVAEEAAKRRAEIDREWSYEELAVAVLTQAKRPLHWREIVNAAEKLSRRSEVVPSSLFNMLTAKGDVFARTDGGTYGLRALGFVDAEPYTELLAQVLGALGKPTTAEYAISEVLKRRDGNAGSLRMALDLNVRFYKSINGLYGLRSWLAPPEMQTLRTPARFVEDSKSYDRVARAERYDVERIVQDDRLRFGDGNRVQ